MRQLCSCTAGDVNLNLRAWGEGRPQLLLVHGFGDNALVWSRFAASLQERVCLLAVDLRGHGSSEWDPAGMYALQDHVLDVTRILDQFCPGPTVLVGHSLGAQIAIRVAAARRERIRALVAVDFGFRPNPLSASLIRRKFRERRTVYATHAQYVAMLSAQLPLAERSLLSELANGALGPNRQGGLEETSDPALADCDDRVDSDATLAMLKRIARPILVVRGEGSAVFSRAAAHELLAEVPQCRLSSVAFSGHTVMLDNPDGFCTAVKSYILRFLSEPATALSDA